MEIPRYGVNDASGIRFRWGQIAVYHEQPVHTVNFTYDYWMSITELPRAIMIR
jgi:formylglycine-generating enzyme required for sulfatase activity